jgi:hypothetical protein
MTLFAHIGGVPFEELLPGAASLLAMTRAWLRARRARTAAPPAVRRSRS